MLVPELQDPDESDPREMRGRAEVDRVVYHLRHVLKSQNVPYSFQSPPSSKRSSTLVFREGGRPNIVDNLPGFQRSANTMVRVIDDVQVIVSFPLVDTQDGHTGRQAIRVSYQLIH